MADRILVYGVTGSGKTALAERISRATGIPWHAVDDLTWEPGWVPVRDDEQRRRIEAICASDCWVLDTAYGKWFDITLARAELIVALDFPRWLSLFRLIVRTVARARDGRVICNGNRESIRHIFSRDSIHRLALQVFETKAPPDSPLGGRLNRPRRRASYLATARRGVACEPRRGASARVTFANTGAIENARPPRYFPSDASS